MPDQPYTIRDKQGNPLQVMLRRDKRLKVTSRWERLPDGALLLRVPYRLPKFRLGSLLEQVRTQLDKAETTRLRRTDAALHERAELINRRHFGGKIHWNAIRWVSNMHTRLGSCTSGGPADAQIRISDKIKGWPDWVIDYVIAHELLHRRHPNHSAEFWNELKAAYPLTERARGFIHGMNFAAGRTVDDE